MSDTPAEDIPEAEPVEEATGWQAKLDEAYPSGASVTLVDDVVEGVGFDESIQFLTPKFLVLEDATPPLVRCQVYGVDKTVTFSIVSEEALSPGVTLFHTPDGHQDVLVSTNLDQDVLNELRSVRMEWYGS